MPETLSEFAPAKINLTLRVGGRRADGYHELESLVAFADFGDELSLAPADTLDLTVAGSTAADCGALGDNLVLKAARALQSRCGTLRFGHFHLTKRMPVAAGLGGGSSDAAAALRLLARANGMAAHDPRLMAAARATGADVPVCLDPRPRIMRGIGDVLSAPLDLPPLHAVLVNPGIAVATAKVFAARAARHVPADAAASPVVDPASHFVETRLASDMEELIAALSLSANDLEAPATKLFPLIGEVLAALRETKTCLLARMSGSGGTCFGLYANPTAASAAANALGEAYSNWWVLEVTLGGASRHP